MDQARNKAQNKKRKHKRQPRDEIKKRELPQLKALFQAMKAMNEILYYNMNIF